MTAIKHLRPSSLPFGFLAGNLSFGSLALSSSAHRVAMVGSMPESATLTHAGFRYNARTGTPPTYRVSLQGLGTTGLPDGTILGGGSPASATFTPPADTTWDNTWQWIALSNSLAVTRGQIIAVVVDYSTGTVDAGNNSSISHSCGNALADFARGAFPYALTDTTGTWSKSAGTLGMPGVKATSRVFGFPVTMQSSATLGTNGHRAALKLSLPAGTGDTYKISGIRFVGTSPATGNAWKIGLWNAAGTALQELEIDSDFSSFVGNALRFHEYYFGSSLATLDFGTNYYVGIERVAASCVIDTLSFHEAGNLDALPGGTDMLLSTWDGSSWTDTDTARPCIEPIIEDWTEPAGGGGDPFPSQGLQHIESGIIA